MAQLLTPRMGWQSEHLGLFILSKFAFCANPVTVSDDLGSDFFCCLFEIRRMKGQECVVPQASFAIQIKSSEGSVDVSNKIPYLADLELPFLLGIVDQKRLRLSLYSGEYLPLLFSKFGHPSRLRIKPVNRRRVAVSRYCERFGSNKYRVLFRWEILRLCRRGSISLTNTGVCLFPVFWQQPEDKHCEILNIECRMSNRRS
jgi:hypothetical protein